MTTEELIKDSLALVGVTNMTPNKNAQSIRFLSNMIASVSTETIKVYATTKESFSLVSGTSEYTIGVGGDFNTIRPDRIIDAFITDGDSDYPLTEIPEAAYNDIFNKANSGRPDFYYFSKEYPLAKITFYFEPDSTYTLNLRTTKALASFSLSTLTDVIVIPDTYLEYIIYNLAIRLAPLYGMSASAEVVSIANSSAKNIENLNSTPVPVIAPEAGLVSSGIKNADWKGE